MTTAGVATPAAPHHSSNDATHHTDAHDGPLTFASLLDALDYREGECLSVCWQPVGGAFASRVVPVREAAAFAASLGHATNVWFGVNATSAVNGGRGTAEQTTRVAALYVDLDVKPGACPDLATAGAIVTDLSALIGQRPTALVFSGHGLQPLWAVDDGDVCAAFTTDDATAFLGRWRRLVELVAGARSIKVDNVFDLARVLRVPGSVNLKSQPVPVVGRVDVGGPLTVAEVDERLTELGIDHQPDDATARDVVSDPGDWTFAPSTCSYVSKWLEGIPSDGPRSGGGRNPWTCSQAVRLWCAVRSGCLSEPDFRRAIALLETRLGVLLATTEPRRALRRFEMRDCFALGRRRASEKSDYEARAELRHHGHRTAEDFWGASNMPVIRGTDAGTAAPNLEQTGHPPSSVLDRLSVNGGWLDRQVFAPLAWSVPGIVPEGLGILVAPPKKGKSFLVADIGLAVAAGGRALGTVAVQQRPVLYLALEDGHRRLQDRFRRILRGGAIPPDVHLLTRATPLEAMTAIVEFIQRHAASRPLVILDTLGKVRPAKQRGDDAYQSDYAVGAQLKGMADAVPGSTLLVVHHTRKAESVDFVDSVSGTQGIAGSVDFILALNRRRHANDAILSVTGRDVTEAEYALIAEGGILWRLDGSDLARASGAVEQRRAAETMGDRQMDVFRFVDAADGAVSATDVAKALDGLDGDTAGKYLRRLADRGWVLKVARGQYIKTMSGVSEVANDPGQGG